MAAGLEPPAPRPREAGTRPEHGTSAGTPAGCAERAASPLLRGTRERAGKTAFGTGLGVGMARDAFRIAAVKGEGGEQMFGNVQGDAPVWDALVAGRCRW